MKNQKSVDQNNQTYEYMFKFVVLGEASVGKSCIILNFVEQKPREYYQITIACDYATRTINTDNKNIRIQIWDTAGAENFRSITMSYYRHCIAAVVVYDISNKKSFESIMEWLEKLRDNSHEQINVILVGNKTDLESKREVTYDEGKNFADEQEIDFVETCAFEYETVEALFIKVTNKILDKIKAGEQDPKNETLGIKIGSKNPDYSSSNRTIDIKAKTEKEERKKCCKPS